MIDLELSKTTWCYIFILEFEFLCRGLFSTGAKGALATITVWRVSATALENSY